MSNTNGEFLGQSANAERPSLDTVALAKALGADVVYPLVGDTPSVLDIVTGNIAVDRTNPIYINEKEAN
jgi:hypothetical protein